MRTDEAQGSVRDAPNLHPHNALCVVVGGRTSERGRGAGVGQVIRTREQDLMCLFLITEQASLQPELDLWSVVRIEKQGETADVFLCILMSALY